MTTQARKQIRLTPQEEDELFMLLVKDDTEDAPWMVMGDAQFWSASSLAHSLRNYKAEQKLGWYVASMLPINYRWGGSTRVHTVAPDVFVAFVEDKPRQSFDVDAEGVFPPFVLEVVSPSSVKRDLEDKLWIYRLMGSQEYALLRSDQAPCRLEGYRRDANGNLSVWPADEEGRMWSDVLGLYLFETEGKAQAMTRDGHVLLTPEQVFAARQEEMAARQQEAAARRQAEDEVARLRAELERLRSGRND